MSDPIAIGIAFVCASGDPKVSDGGLSGLVLDDKIGG